MTDNLGNTWTSEYKLVCDSEYLKNVAEMFFLVGVATGGIISGYLSDRFGRRTMLFWSVIFQTIFGKCNQSNAIKYGLLVSHLIFPFSFAFFIFEKDLYCTFHCRFV